MRLKKPQRRTLKQKDRGVVLNKEGLAIIVKRMKNHNNPGIKSLVLKNYPSDVLEVSINHLLKGARPGGVVETALLSELRGMGLVKIDHTKVSIYDETGGA